MNSQIIIPIQAGGKEDDGEGDNDNDYENGLLLF